MDNAHRKVSDNQNGNSGGFKVGGLLKLKRQLLLQGFSLLLVDQLCIRYYILTIQMITEDLGEGQVKVAISWNLKYRPNTALICLENLIHIFEVQPQFSLKLSKMLVID